MTQKAVFHYLRYPWGVSFTGMLLTVGPEGGVLIDTALPEAVDSFLLPQFQRIGFSLSSLRMVINTHSHGDHAGGNARLRELCDAKFAIHQESASQLAASGFPVDLQLKDGERLECAGLRLEILHTPGHSPDSVCVLESESGTLFCGDSLQGGGNVYTGIALYSDPEAYLQSVAKIEALFRQGRIRRILCGHANAPFDGDVSETDIPVFLKTCRDSVLQYARAAEAYLTDHPHPEAAEFGRQLLERFGVTTTPGLPGLENGTARVHLRCAENGILLR